MHDPLAVHMLQRTTNLCKVLPDGPFWNEPFLCAEVSDHAVKVAGVGHLQNDVQLVVLDERGQIFDYIRVVQLLKLDMKR